MDFKVKLISEVENSLKKGDFTTAFNLVTAKENDHDLKFSCSDLMNVVTKHLTDENYKEKPDLFGACEKILKEIAARANKEDVLFELLELMENVKSDELLISLLKSLQVVLLRMNHKNSQVSS